MGNKPELVLHAGFPKCATTTLQRLFVIENHRVARDLGVVWLGKRFEPFNGWPPVSEIMYDRARALEDIQALNLDPGARHFLSSEALSGAPDVLAALESTFRISRVILTIRLPALMALSSYCFSGWITGAPEESIFDRQQVRVANVVRSLSAAAPVMLCPIEADKLPERFCETAFGASLDNIGTLAHTKGNLNASVPPAVAVALDRALAASNARPIPGPGRQGFAKAARENPGPRKFQNVLPEPFAMLLSNRDRMSEWLHTYEDLLRTRGVSGAVCAQSIERARTRLLALAERPIPDADMTARLNDHARDIIDIALAQKDASSN